MKFKMLVGCLIAGMLLVSFPKVYAYAAEEGTIVSQENVTNIESTDADKTGTINNNPAGTVTTPTDPAQTAETGIAPEQTQESAEELSEGNEDIIEDVIEVEEDSEDSEEDQEKAQPEEKKEKKKVTKKVKYSKSDLRLLSALIYCEANGESYQGKLAVGIVVMNRKRSGAFPDSVKGVIYQKYQFGPASNGSLDRALKEYDDGDFTSDAELECIKAAKAALSGEKYITVNGDKKNFIKYLYFSCNLRNSTYKLGNHEFK